MPKFNTGWVRREVSTDTNPHDRRWEKFRRIFWTPNPLDHNPRPDMLPTRPMANIGLSEQLLNVEYYAGYLQPEWQRQNAAEAARGIAQTTLPASYVVGHRVPAVDSLGEPDPSTADVRAAAIHYRPGSDVTEGRDS